jgi:uncharacterized protein (UPF0332 family)
LSDLESLLMAKASASLEQARLLFDAGHFDGAVDRAYYAMFHAASALLARQGLRFSSHRALLAAFGKELAKTGDVERKYHRILLSAFDLRQTADYGAQTAVDASEARDACQAAIDFLAMARTRLEGQSPDKT